MEKDGYYNVQSILDIKYRQAWRSPTLWEGYGMSEATSEPISVFIRRDGTINVVLQKYLQQNQMETVLREVETRAPKRRVF